MQIPSLVCVADAVRISSSLSDALAECTRQHWTGDQRRQYCSTSVWHPELGRVGLSTMPFGMLNVVGDPHNVSLLLTSLLSSIPQGWLSSLAPPLSPPPGPSSPLPSPSLSLLSAPGLLETPPAPPPVSLMRLLVSRLGWILPCSPFSPPLQLGPPATLGKFKVKLGTTLLNSATGRLQAEARAVYVGLAMGPPHNPRYVTGCTRMFARRLSALWSFPWENQQKEIMWRLAADGVRGASSRVQFRCPCCPDAPPNSDARMHSFWTCPVAVAVRDAIQTTLLASTTVPLQRASLWLCYPRPSSTINLEVWGVVCLAALSAMDHGRLQAWRLHYAASNQALLNQGQRTLYEVWGLTNPHEVASRPISVRAGALAVTDFWARIADFVAIGAPPDDWEDTVDSSHPFISHGGARVNMGSPPQTFPHEDASLIHDPPLSPPPIPPSPSTLFTPVLPMVPLVPSPSHTHRLGSQLILPEEWSYD